MAGEVIQFPVAQALARVSAAAAAAAVVEARRQLAAAGPMLAARGSAILSSIAMARARAEVFS